MASSQRKFSLLDNVLIEAEQLLTTVFAKQHASRPYPGTQQEQPRLSSKESRHVAGLMRVNHAGEVAAQALYNAQALTARSEDVKQQMQHAAEEEVDHLAWCRQRLEELGSHPSRLDVLWYLGSFTIGSIAGLAGDKWNLGFVIETEKQVVAHLTEHLEQLPTIDQRSAAVLQQMQQDEEEHAELAKDAGGAELPAPVKWLMARVSKVMTTAAYYV